MFIAWKTILHKPNRVPDLQLQLARQAVHKTLRYVNSGWLGAALTSGMCKKWTIYYLKEVWRLVLITPLLELRVGIDNHAAPHPRDSKELNVIARVTIHKHSVFGSSHQLFHLQATLCLTPRIALCFDCRTTAQCFCEGPHWPAEALFLTRLLTRCLVTPFSSSVMRPNDRKQLDLPCYNRLV